MKAICNVIKSINRCIEKITRKQTNIVSSDLVSSEDRIGDGVIPPQCQYLASSGKYLLELFLDVLLAACFTSYMVR